MPSLDIFNDDAFSMVSLTKAINTGDHLPQRLAELGLFSEEGITTTSAMIEQKGETLSLVPAGTRGAPADNTSGDKAKLIPFPTVHLPQRSTVLADSIQNLRSFGSETEVETVQTVVNKRLEKLRRNIDATIEYHRMGAIKGQVLDADGTSVLLDLYTAFGVSQQTQAMALATTTTKVRDLIVKAKRKAEDALGAQMYRGMRAFCSADFFDAFVSHPAVEAAYDRWMNGEFLRADVRSGFYHGGVFWEEYRGTVGAVPFIASGDAYLVPEGVPDLFVTNYAPADYEETVNTIGLPYYAKQEQMRMGKGREIEAQSNPLCLNTRPRAIIKLTA
ncbi:MAG: major capsid protein [Thiobacillus sp.]|nr:major capsid protein [Thiobacillus sp.]